MDVITNTLAQVLAPLKPFNDYMNNFEYSSETPFTNYRWPFSFSFGYLVVIWLLHKFMANRAPMKVYWAGLIHNFNMFALSLIMLIGLVYGMVRGLWVRNNICNGNVLIIVLRVTPWKSVQR